MKLRSNIGVSALNFNSSHSCIDYGDHQLMIVEPRLLAHRFDEVAMCRFLLIHFLICEDVSKVCVDFSEAINLIA